MENVVVNMSTNLGINMTTNLRPMTPNVRPIFSIFPVVPEIMKIQNYGYPPNLSNVPLSHIMLILSDVWDICYLLCFLLFLSDARSHSIESAEPKPAS